MARINQNIAPYYNDYDSNKQYSQILAIPGRVAQAREITQIQSVVKDIVKGIGDSFMRDGNIIEGCQVSINEAEKIATISPGKVYLDGMVLPVNGGLDDNGDPLPVSVSIKGVGSETIGFILNERLITETDDNTLRDPAQGYANFNQPGCHRIKSEVGIVVDDPNSAILVTLLDGAVTVEKYAPEYDKMTQVLAERTQDESGSYIVRGFNVRVVEDTKDTNNKVKVLVEEGLAYINGYRLSIPSSRQISINRSLVTVKTTNYPLVYQEGTSTYTIYDKGKYVKDINSVVAPYQYTTHSMGQPSSNTAQQDIIKPSNYRYFSSIVSVISGGKEYTENLDFRIEGKGNNQTPTITWLGTDNYPTSSYTIVYNYYAVFTKDEDYVLDDSQTLKWLVTGTHPIAGGTMFIDYDYYLARKDVVYIDQYGDISVTEGIPAEYNYESLPEAPAYTLPLAYISHAPGGTHEDIVVSNIALTRFTMSDIQNLLNRIRNLEYNQAVDSLNDTTRQHAVGGTRKSIFTDPLIDFSKIDYSYSAHLEDNIEGQDKTISVGHDSTIDFNSNICYLPTKSDTYDLVYDSLRSTSKKYNRLVTLSKTGETAILSQMSATRSFLINPYSTFPQLPEISLSPAVDSWIEDNIIEIPVSQKSTDIVSSSTRHVESSVMRGGSFRDYTVATSDVVDTAIGTRVTTSTNESVINELALTYIRSREITVVGNNFPPNLGNIKCYFEGVPLQFNIEGGGKSDYISSDANGGFTAKFTIPPNTFMNGIREVRLETETPGYESEGSAIALYQASGMSRNIQRTVTTMTTVLLNRVTTINSTTYVDPVGQTFVLDRMSLISGIDLYFEAKPEANIPVTCDIREVINGAITSKILAHKTLYPEDIKVSSDSGTATRFNFDDPVLLEENKEYAFVVRSTSTAYRIWIAELGKNDILTGGTVLTNPYLIGVMMSSSNNSSWTNHQTSDVKFRLISDKYESASNDLYFEKITPEQFSRLYLLADSIIPNGTSVDWYYSTDNWTTSTPITPYNIKLLNSMQGSLDIRATLRRISANDNLSPIIALDTVGAVLSCYAARDLEDYTVENGVMRYDSAGSYMSLSFPKSNSNKVDILLDTYIPDDDVSLEVYVSTDNGKELIPTTYSGITATLNYGWVERKYTADIESDRSECKVFIYMKSKNQYKTPAFARLRAITYIEDDLI